MQRSQPTLFLTSAINEVADSIGSKLRANQRRVPLLFVDTAAEVEEGDKQWLLDDREALVQAGFSVTDFSITGKKGREIVETLRDQEVVFVEGGNTHYLLYQMQQSGFTAVIHDYVPRKLIYIGSSAGSIVAGPNISPVKNLDDKNKAPKLNDLDGLGLSDLVIFPHWGSDDFRDIYMTYRLDEAYDSPYKHVLLRDTQYAEVFTDGRYRIVDVKSDE